MENESNQFSYQSKQGTVSGSFALYQSPSGGIILQLGENLTELMHGQVARLCIHTPSLIGFDLVRFKKRYLLSDQKAEDMQELFSGTISAVIDNLFYDLHQMAETKTGDIDPMQEMELEELLVELEKLKGRLTKLIPEQVVQNMEPAPKKQRIGFPSKQTSKTNMTQETYRPWHTLTRDEKAERVRKMIEKDGFHQSWSSSEWAIICAYGLTNKDKRKCNNSEKKS